MRKHTRRAERPKSATKILENLDRGQNPSKGGRDEDTVGTRADLSLSSMALSAKPFASDTTLAILIDSSRSTVWRYVRTGILPPPLKIGGLTRFDVAHAMACIRAGRIVPWPRSEE
jgi:predicted DNA-binding transcriptional regulator AlpA